MFLPLLLGTQVNGERDIDSESSNNIRSWFAHRVLHLFDKSPTSEEIHVDYMYDKNFYELFVKEMLDVYGLPLDQVPLRPAFNKIWKTEFRHVKIPKMKSVDSKDQVRHISVVIREC